VRAVRVKFPLDLAWFMAFLWYFLAPYYLWRTQRWRGLGKFGALLAAVVLSYLANMTIAFVLGEAG
jgi:hypothetical protein